MPKDAQNQFATVTHVIRHILIPIVYTGTVTHDIRHILTPIVHTGTVNHDFRHILTPIVHTGIMCNTVSLVTEQQ